MKYIYQTTTWRDFPEKEVFCKRCNYSLDELLASGRYNGAEFCDTTFGIYCINCVESEEKNNPDFALGLAVK